MIPGTCAASCGWRKEVVKIKVMSLVGDQKIASGDVFQAPRSSIEEGRSEVMLQ